MTEITEFLVVEEEDAAHADVRKIAETEIGNPEVRVRTKRIGDGIIHLFEHFIICLERLVLLENAVLVEKVVIVFHAFAFIRVNVDWFIGIFRVVSQKRSSCKVDEANAGRAADKRLQQISSIH